MLDMFLEPDPQVYCPLCGQEADLSRGRIDCSKCGESHDIVEFDFEGEACHGY